MCEREKKVLNKAEQGGWEFSSVVGHLSSKRKALGMVLSSGKTKIAKTGHGQGTKIKTAFTEL